MYSRLLICSRNSISSTLMKFSFCHAKPQKRWISSGNMSLVELHNSWIARLKNAEVPEPELSLKYITEHVIGRETIANWSNNCHPSREEVEKIDHLCHLRLQRIPVQYIIGEWDFRYLNLTMKPPVFIPRPETEELVDLVAGHHFCASEKFFFLEVGCGSGAVSLALLSEYPSKTRCVAIDKSQEAVNLTRHNARRIGVEEQMFLHCADVGSILDLDHPKLYDAIVSNPPYIPEPELALLDPEVRSCEDVAALCGGPDGLDVVRKILQCAQRLLRPQGSLWLEVDLTHPPLVEDWIRRRPELGLQYICTYNDFTRRPRFCHIQSRGLRVAIDPLQR